MGRKKGWFFTSDAPAREPNRLASSLIKSLRINDLHKLWFVSPVASASFGQNFHLLAHLRDV